MKTSELTALGLTREQARAVQQLHGRDVTELQRKFDAAPDRAKNVQLREACAAVLLTLRRPSSLRRVLDYAVNVHYRETHAEDLHNEK